MKRIMFSVYFGFSVLAAIAGDKTHIVKQGETLYAISKQYNISIDELRKLNALTANDPIKPGQSLVVARTTTTGSAVTKTDAPVKAVAPATGTSKAKMHTVSKGETLYTISKHYGVTVADIKAWNKLPDSNVKPGQQLVVNKTNQTAIYRPMAVAGTPDTPYTEEDTKPRSQQVTALTREIPPVASNNNNVPTATVRSEPASTLKAVGISYSEYSDFFNRYNTQGFKMKKSRGTASFLQDETSGNPYLAFCNIAETGTIVRVTNLVNQKTIFVKVMGKVPATESGNDVVLKITGKAADELGATDNKFLVEVASYTAN